MLTAFFQALNNVEDAGRTGSYGNLSPFASSGSSLDPETSDGPALSAQFTFTQGDVAKDSAVYVFGRRKRIVKLRVTSPVAEAETAKTEGAAFLKAVAAWMR